MKIEETATVRYQHSLTRSTINLDDPKRASGNSVTLKLVFKLQLTSIIQDNRSVR